MSDNTSIILRKLASTCIEHTCMLKEEVHCGTQYNSNKYRKFTLCLFK